MRRFSYEYWKDIATIISYFLFAFSLMIGHLNIHGIAASFVLGIGIFCLIVCGINMTIEEIKKRKYSHNTIN
jgi:uncharacterized membrane protein